MDNEDLAELDRLTKSLVRVFHIDDPRFWGSKYMDLSLKEIHALVAIDESHGGKIKDIRAAIGAACATMTRFLDRLENRGFIKRTMNSEDRRSFGLVVTKKGKAAVADHSRGHKTISRIITSPLTKEELHSLLRLLGKIESEDGKKRLNG